MAMVYLVEVGVLIDNSDPEYEAYSRVYDKAHGFYDEDQSYVKTLDDAISYAKDYVIKGAKNTYAVVSESALDDVVVEESEADEPFIDAEVYGEDYDVDSVVFSAVKTSVGVVENFLGRAG